MTETTDLAQLERAWRSTTPRAPEGESLVRLMVDRFRAYEISTTIHPADDFVMDSDVHEADVWRLFTIDDPDILRTVISGPVAEVEALRDVEPEWTEWRAILGSLEAEVESNPPVGFYLTTVQHTRGERVSILLESADKKHVDGFKVYGLSEKVFSFMLAHVGWGKWSRSPQNPYGVRIGDLDDEDFCRYLRCAWGEGVLRLPGSPAGHDHTLNT